MVDKLSSLLGISLEEAQGMAHGPDHFIVSSFPDRFRSMATVRDWDAFAICVLGTLFTVYSFGICHRSLLDVVVQWRRGYDIVPLILGETLQALDRLSTGKRYMHGGSPVLLSMWLMERLGVFGEAVGRVHPWTFTRRGSTVQIEDQGAWELWMARLRTRDLRWWIPHWGIETRRTCQEGSYIVVVPGLYQTSFYIPSLVMRQFGMEQQILHGFDDISTMTVVSMSMGDPASILILAESLGICLFPCCGTSSPVERTFLTTEYLDWYERHMGVTQLEILGRREALPGFVGVAAMELRRGEARACPYDRRGDTMTDYADLIERRRDRVPLGMQRVQMAGDRERAAQALRDAGTRGSCLGSRAWEEED